MLACFFLFPQNLRGNGHQENHRENNGYDAYLVHDGHVNFQNCNNRHKHQRQDEGFRNAAEHFRGTKTHDSTPTFPEFMGKRPILIFSLHLAESQRQNISSRTCLFVQKTIYSNLQFPNPTELTGKTVSKAVGERRKMGKNEIDLMVLGVLLAGPAHGYYIKKRIAISFGAQYPNLSDSAIYPRLLRFEKEGFIKSKIEMQYNAPNKKVYQLTENGMEKIKRLVATPVQFRKVRNTDMEDLIVHALFFSFITKEERRTIVEPFFKYTKERYDDAIAKMEKYKEQLDRFALALLESGIPLLKANMEMYKKLMEM